MVRVTLFMFFLEWEFCVHSPSLPPSFILSWTVGFKECNTAVSVPLWVDSGFSVADGGVTGDCQFVKNTGSLKKIWREGGSPYSEALHSGMGPCTEGVYCMGPLYTVVGTLPRADRLTDRCKTLPSRKMFFVS